MCPFLGVSPSECYRAELIVIGLCCCCTSDVLYLRARISLIRLNSTISCILDMYNIFFFAFTKDNEIVFDAGFIASLVANNGTFYHNVH